MNTLEKCAYGFVAVFFAFIITVNLIKESEPDKVIVKQERNQSKLTESYAVDNCLRVLGEQVNVKYGLRAGSKYWTRDEGDQYHVDISYNPARNSSYYSTRITPIECKVSLTNITWETF